MATNVPTTFFSSRVSHVPPTRGLGRQAQPCEVRVGGSLDHTACGKSEAGYTRESNHSWCKRRPANQFTIVYSGVKSLKIEPEYTCFVEWCAPLSGRALFLFLNYIGFSWNKTFLDLDWLAGLYSVAWFIASRLSVSRR